MGNRPGRVILLTGEGKGKSSSAFGMVLRAAGWGMKVGVVQFLKGKRRTGEQMGAAQLPGVVWHAMGEGFSREGEDPSRHADAARGAWEFSRQLWHQCDLVVLDEILYAVGMGLLSGSEIAAAVRREKPPPVHLVLTGRGLDPDLLAVADTVTEMKPLRHPFKDGVGAAKGIEF